MFLGADGDIGDDIRWLLWVEGWEGWLCKGDGGFLYDTGIISVVLEFVWYNNIIMVRCCGAN